MIASIIHLFKYELNMPCFQSILYLDIPFRAKILLEETFIFVGVR